MFRLGSNSSIDSLNPFVAFQSDAYTTFEYIYPFLVQYNTKVQVTPDFATSWTVSDGGRVWTFHTVANAKWSDGRPMTAADAAWTFSTILKFQNGPDGEFGGLRGAHGERDRSERHDPDPDLQAAGRQRPVTGAAGADPAPAHLGPVRRRHGQGPEDLRQQRADRVRRPVHAVQVHAEAGRAVPAQPDVLRAQAAHPGPRARVLQQRRRDDYRAEVRPAGRRGDRPAVHSGRSAQGRAVRRVADTGRRVRRLHHQ